MKGCVLCISYCKQEAWRPSPHHDNHRPRGHVLYQTGIERLSPQLMVMLWKEILRHLDNRASYIYYRHQNSRHITHTPANKSIQSTCNIFRPTSLKPLCSKRWIIFPTRRRWTPSGFTAMRVRSAMSGIPGEAQAQQEFILIPALAFHTIYNLVRKQDNRLNIDPNSPSLVQENTTYTSYLTSDGVDLGLCAGTCTSGAIPMNDA